VKEEEVIGKLIDFSPIKEFGDYGFNKTVIDLKVRKMVDVQTREMLSKLKPQTNWTQFMMIILIAVIVGMIAFSIVNQYMSYDECSKERASEYMKTAVCEANLMRAGITPEGGATGTGLKENITITG
jgi:hypothetical protein